MHSCTVVNSVPCLITETVIKLGSIFIIETFLYCDKLIDSRTNSPPPPPGQNPPMDKTPRGQIPPPDKTPPDKITPDNSPLDKTPVDKTPPDKTPPRTKPHGQNPPSKTPFIKPPGTKPPGQNAPEQNPPEKTPPGNPPPTLTSPLQNTPNTNHHGKTTQNKPQIPNKAPRGQKPGKFQDGVHFKFRWLQSSIINMMNGKLYVYIQLQMRYLIASGST